MANETPLKSTSWLYHPEFPGRWERRRLYSLARWVNGLAFRSNQFSPSGKPVIKIAEVKNGISGQTKFTKQLFDQSVCVRRGDLLFSWSGQPESSIDAFWWHGPQGWLNQHVFRVTPADGISRTFFYYLLRYLKPCFVGIARNKQTTGLGHVTKRDLQDIKVGLPKPAEQRAIAEVLGSLDDKIELNRRMNETLEAIARAIFKSWFVDFDAVKAKAAGATSFPTMPQPVFDALPTEFTDSPLGPIPKGWEVRSVYSCATYINGSAFRNGHFSPDNTGHPIIKIAELKSGITNQTKFTELMLDAKYFIDSGDILFSWSGSPDTSIDTFLWAKGQGWLNQHIFKVIPANTLNRVFVYYLLKHLKSTFIEIARDKQTTGLGHVTVRDLKAMQVVIPPAELLEGFAALAKPMFERSYQNQLENQVLEQTRDALLPKLLLGEILVGTAEKMVEEVA